MSTPEPDDRLSLDEALELVAALRRAVRTGQTLDLAVGVPEADLDPGDSANWPALRRIPAELVRQVLLDPDVRPDPRGLDLRGAALTGWLDLHAAGLRCELGFDRCQFEQTPQLASASIGALNLEGCHLPGLNVNGARLAGGAALARLTCTGQVRALGVQIGGQLHLEGATLTNPAGAALILDGATIDGDAFLERLTATGEVRAVGATIRQLTLQDAGLSNPAGTALNLERARIQGGVFLGRLTATGQVRALGAQISGQLHLEGATLTNPDGEAFNGQRLQVDQLFLDDDVAVEGTLDLTRAQLGDVITDGQSPPGPLVAAGWRVADLHGVLRTDRRAAARWLTSAPRFVAQPWHELAQVYDRNGQPSDARFLRLRAATLTTRHGPWWSKPPRWGYGLLVGYGYLPLLAGGWLVAALLTGWLVTSTHRASFAPGNPAALQSGLAASSAPPGNPNPAGTAGTTPPVTAATVTGATSCRQLRSSYPCLRPLLYSLDVVLPPTVSTGQSTAWRPTQTWIAYTLTGLRTFGWLLTALLLAGVTGLLRKS